MIVFPFAKLTRTAFALLVILVTLTLSSLSLAQNSETISNSSNSNPFLNNLLNSESPASSPLPNTAPKQNADTEVLSPEEAFQPTVSFEDGYVVVDFEIDDCCYLYQHKLQLSSADANLTFGKLQLPPAASHEDPNFGKVMIYEHGFRFTVPAHLSNGNNPSVTFHYQGCAEMGICYPPQTLEISLAIPSSTEPAPESFTNPSTIVNFGDKTDMPQPVSATEVAKPETASAGGIQNAQTAIVDRLTRDRYGALMWFFLAGVLLSFTPCVFPMIPILSGIIVGQGEGLSRSRGFMLSLSYVLGMAITYTAAGLIAGLLGANLQITFQKPWILLLFASIFVLFALAMFGLFNLQLPASLQSKLNASTEKLGGNIFSTFVMGALSALIVGPCVAPPLAAVLSVITATGDPILGGSALFIMSIGMGVPLLLIGLSAGALLPKAGAWMNGIKYFFGILMLAVAIMLVSRLIPPPATLLLWGALLLLSAVFCGAFDALETGSSIGKRFFKALGLVLALLGALEVIGAAMGNDNPYQPIQVSQISGDTTSHVAEKSFTTITSLDEFTQLKQANAGKPIMLDFYADWCTYCKDFERYTFPDAAVQQHFAEGDFVLVKADVTANDAENQTLMKYFNIIAPPAILFFDRSGQELEQHRLIKFTKAEPFAAHLADIRSKI